jgi:hypothetical protein
MDAFFGEGIVVVIKKVSSHVWASEAQKHLVCPRFSHPTATAIATGEKIVIKKE